MMTVANLVKLVALVALFATSNAEAPMPADFAAQGF